MARKKGSETTKIPSPTRFDPITLGKRAQRVRVGQGLSIEQLAKQTGLNKNTIVRFEKGLSTRLDTIYRICEALDSSPFGLMESGVVDGRDYSVRKQVLENGGKPVHHYSQRAKRVRKKELSGMEIGELDYKLPGGMLNAVVLEVSDKSAVRSHPGEEVLFCLAGDIGVQIGDASVLLHKGDAVFFWGTEPHVYSNASEDKPVSVALSIWSDPRPRSSHITYHE